MSFEFVKPDSSKVIFKFDGRLDTIKCRELDEKVVEKAKDCKTIVFDLEKVSYVSSSFLRICSICAQLANSGGFSFINVSPSIRKVFKISGIDNLIKAEV
ncbi:MAG TPA: hypothetical protein DD381_08570 [Lentisphaeria bacterium]|nr:MAG: hypothetical protein A2X47_11115 [Lentisphaerae bacterium GWF2_38_69]HBM16376.1 hypothetical protein [Lentisphaeria bacterium]